MQLHYVRAAPGISTHAYVGRHVATAVEIGSDLRSADRPEDRPRVLNDAAANVRLTQRPLESRRSAVFTESHEDDAGVGRPAGAIFKEEC